MKIYMQVVIAKVQVDVRRASFEIKNRNLILT